MSPRRPFPPRRFPPPPRRQRPIHGRPPRSIPPKLKKANLLFENGDYEKAAQLYEEFAEGAKKRGLPQAFRLYIQAGRSLLLVSERAKGIELIEKGLKQLKSDERWRELRVVGRRVVNELKEKDFLDEAEKVDVWLQEMLGASYEQGDDVHVDHDDVKQVADTKKVQLPLRCPDCGAALHPNEVEWIDAETAECGYCGNLVRGENV